MAIDVERPPAAPMNAEGSSQSARFGYHLGLARATARTADGGWNPEHPAHMKDADTPRCEFRFDLGEGSRGWGGCSARLTEEGLHHRADEGLGAV